MHIISYNLRCESEGDKMIINLRDLLKSDRLTYTISDELKITDSEFLKKNKIDESVIFNGEFFKVDDKLVLNAKFSYKYDEVCARCLREFKNTVETRFSANIVNENVIDDDSSEINIILENNCIDLEDAIEQSIYLSLPMKALCTKDCKGICHKCGANLNFEKCDCDNSSIDPRFVKLKKLLKD